MSNEVIESLNECHVQKPMLDFVSVMKWPSDLDIITLTSDTITISRNQLEKIAMSDENSPSRPVKATAIDLRWFFAHQQNFITFAEMLNALPSGFYTSKFMVFLLNRFWEPAKTEIIYKQLLPNLVFIVIAITYFHRSLQQ